MKIAVVGAGIAGLAAATRLAKRGHRVQVLEAGPRVGGRALVVRGAATGDLCDVGTQYYHSSYERALGLMRETGLTRSLHQIAGATRFFDERAPGGSFLLHHRLPWLKTAGVAGNLRVAGLLARLLLRNPIRTFEAEDRPALDDVLALDAIRDPVAREFIVRTLVVVGSLSEPAVAHPSLLQVLRLVRIILLTDYLSLAGGVSSLHQALADRLDVRLETPVDRLVVEGGRTRGIALASGEVVAADHVVVATTAPQAAPLLPEEWTFERGFLAGVTLPPAIIVSFFLDRPLEPGVWSYFMPSDHPGVVSLCIDAQQKNPAMAPSGRAILQAWVCYPSSAQFTGESDARVVDVCRGELDVRFSGFSSWIEEAVVTRHAMGVPWHPAGHGGRALRFLDAADRRRDVSFCGDYLSGGYLECALWSVDRAAARVG